MDLRELLDLELDLRSSMLAVRGGDLSVEDVLRDQHACTKTLPLGGGPKKKRSLIGGSRHPDPRLAGCRRYPPTTTYGGKSPPEESEGSSPPVQA